MSRYSEGRHGYDGAPRASGGLGGPRPGPPCQQEILDALREVIDPEIGISVVDLGLVYEAQASDGRVRVVMTTTAPACPLGESIADDAEAAIRRRVPGVTSVAVELVSEPRWQPSMMSNEARRRLGWR